MVAATASAYQQFRPDVAFRASCERVTARIENILNQLLPRAAEANGFAELATIAGDCEYTKIE
jgi:hypothetical protein